MTDKPRRPVARATLDYIIFSTFDALRTEINCWQRYRSVPLFLEILVFAAKPQFGPLCLHETSLGFLNGDYTAAQEMLEYTVEVDEV